LGQALVDEHFDFNATIFSAAFAGLVVGYRIGFTEPIRGHDTTKRNLVVLNQVTNDRVGATLTQLAIAFGGAGGVGKAGDLEHIALGVERLGRDRVQLGLGIGI